MRYFTPQSASATLPLVRRIAGDLVELQADLTSRGERVEVISGNVALAMSAAHAEELADIRASLTEDRQRMMQIDKELSSIGARVHSATLGAIDFPALLGTREVRLCWLPGDSAVHHWHEIKDPPTKRRAIVDERFQSPPERPPGSGSDRGSETGPSRSLRP